MAQVRGNPNDDWHIQCSTNMENWVNLKSVGTLLSGAAKAPMRSLGEPGDSMTFYRAVKTSGLFDPTLLRTLSLTFFQTNWQTELAKGHAKRTNVYCSLLTLDNGARKVGIGARYRGYTSYWGTGGKNSLNLEIDFTVPGQDLMGYDTINLNNAYEDETIMREALYFNVMRKYTICPAACLAQLYINGINWGVYSCVQQQDGRLVREYCPSSSGDRWRAPNMASVPGSSVSAFSYLGTTNVSAYTNKYELKSDYNTNAWPRLINAIYVFNTTPTNQLREIAEEVLAVDRWLWFLALENIFADDDSYWNKGADYMFYYEPESDRIHPASTMAMNLSLRATPRFRLSVAWVTSIGHSLITCYRYQSFVSGISLTCAL